MRHIEPVANPHRSALRDLPPPQAWQSRNAERLVSAILSGRTITDVATAPARLPCTIRVSDIPLGTSPESAARTVAEGLAHAEREIARMRGILRMYGGTAFAPAPEPERAPREEPGDTQESYMLRWLASVRAAGRVIVRAGDVRFICDPFGIYWPHEHDTGER